MIEFINENWHKDENNTFVYQRGIGNIKIWWHNDSWCGTIWLNSTGQKEISLPHLQRNERDTALEQSEKMLHEMLFKNV